MRKEGTRNENPLRSLTEAVRTERHCYFFTTHRTGIWMRGIILGLPEGEAERKTFIQTVRSRCGNAAFARMMRLHERYVMLEAFMDRELEKGAMPNVDKF